MARAVSILDGDRVRDELVRRNLTQRQFAERVNLREATISRAIHGHGMDAVTIFRIALGLEALPAS